MTEKQINRYLELVDRRLFLLLHSGKEWKPEHGKEMEQIDRELGTLRPLVERAHEKRKEGAA